jgi:7-cyano-7-deazaguanine synthase
MASQRATVLLSGGIDSAVVLALLAADGCAANAIWIDYAQPAAAAEREASNAIASSYGAIWNEVILGGLKPPTMGEFPGRNDVLVALAASYTSDRLIGIGIHAGTNYVDCSPVWLEGWQELLAREYQGRVDIFAPLVTLEKAQVYALARQLDVPMALTYSCETGDTPCGSCLSCKDRRLLDDLS